MLDYIYRIKDLRTTILDAERREKGHVNSQFLTEIDDLIARTFCQSLPLEYRIQMGPKTRFTDAFTAAKAIAKQQELDKQRLEPKPRERDMQYAAPIGRPVAYSTPLPPDRFNYRNDNPCREIPRREATRDSRNSNSPRRNADLRDLRSNNKFCRYCKNRGHDIEECRKRQYIIMQGKTSWETVTLGRQNGTRTDEMSKTRLMQPINVEEEENDSESQS